MEDKFIYNQPKKSNDLRCNKDCMIRAVCIATVNDYKDVYGIMYGYGWRTSRKPTGDNWEDQVTKTLTKMGFQWYKESFPAIKSKPRMTVEQFITDHPTGTYILRVSKHVFAVINGVVNDTFYTPNKCVYFAWRVY